MAESNIKRNISIIEEGTSGIWTYRKWSDGTAECWGTYKGTVSAWQVWGNVYFGQPYTSFYTQYPTNLFISKPTVMAQPNTIGIDAWLGYAATTGSKDTTPSFYPIRAESASGGADIYVGIYAIGKWR